MREGDKVRWAHPLTEDERREVFTLVECNGDRCIIRFDCDLPFPPTQIVRTDDLVLCTL